MKKSELKQIIREEITKVLNEEKYPNFQVGERYMHKKYGEFEVIELMKGQNTKVQFKKEPKPSIIAGWSSEGYPKIS
jgi:hypothetical protein